MSYKRLFGFFLAVLLVASSMAGAQSRQNETISPDDRDQPPDTQAYPQNMPAENQTVPPALTLPAGTLIAVRTTQPLSSDRNRPGDSFTTILDQPVVVQGWVVARRGQTAIGKVAIAQRADRNRDNSQLAIELNELMLVDGQQVPIRTELAEISGGGGPSPAEKTAAVGATTGIGAVIGAVAGGGEGAAIGAVVGAAAGIAGVLSTRGRPTEIYPETGLTFRLERSITISTGQSQQAFMPVIQEDYSHNPTRNPDRYPSARNNPPPVYYAPPYDYGWYGSPYGYYGHAYYGPWYYPGLRIYVRPGRHRGRW